MAGALGRALLRVWGPGAKKSYKAVGWHAQLSQITAVKEGSAAADKAGLHVKQARTIKNWLSEKTTPTPRDQRLIAKAYHILAGRWNSANETRHYAIDGLIDSGDRIEGRVLHIGSGDYESARWDRLAAEFDAGDPDPLEIERLFIEDVIVPDIGESSPRIGQSGTDDEEWQGEYGWDFPGSFYTV